MTFNDVKYILHKGRLSETKRVSLSHDRSVIITRFECHHHNFMQKTLN